MKKAVIKKSLGFWLIAAAVLILDRITKELAPGLPADGFTLIPGVIGLRYAENTGIAFWFCAGYDCDAVCEFSCVQCCGQLPDSGLCVGDDQPAVQAAGLGETLTTARGKKYD